MKLYKFFKLRNSAADTGGTGRSIADIEAELASIDAAAHEQAITATTTTDPATTTHDYTFEAKRKGWKPEGEYEGPENSWVDAKTFIERGERFTKKLENEISALKTQINSFEGTKAQFRKFFDDQMAKRDREHADAIATLRIQRSQAIREGDDALAIEIEDRIDATKEQQKTFKAEAETSKSEVQVPTTSAAAADSPVLLEWIEDGHNWFKKDEVLTKHAIAVGETFRREGDKSQGRAFLDKVAAQVRADFPRRMKAFDTPDQAQQRPSGTGSSAQGGTATTPSPVTMAKPSEICRQKILS